MIGESEAAEELKQETFLAVYKNIRTLRGDSKLRTWLCGIAKNLVYKFLRSRRKESAIGGAEIESLNIADEKKILPDREFLSKELNGVIREALADVLETTERLPLSRADEIKIAAFQSLLNADPKRAIETTGEVLSPGSKASETLKQVILRVWRNLRLFVSPNLTANIAKNIGDKELAALLRETLIKSFQSETNPKIRREIIYTLAAAGDEQTTDYLKKSYWAESDREVKKAIIDALGSAENMLGGLNADLAMRKAESDMARVEQQKKNLPANERKRELDALLEIVRGEKDIELRRLALSSLNRFSNWLASGPAVETIKGLYDTETDEEFKITLIDALAESEQSSAVRKLLDIAKNDKSDKLRLAAIHSLRNSKDPEVLKFLEDLIK